MITVHFRFYEELNNYLPEELRKVWFDYHTEKNSTMAEVIKSIGVPLEEIDLILVNQQAKKSSYTLQNNDRISVYPIFETFDLTRSGHLHDKPLRNPTFICDVHLGKLCKLLRMLGFDTLYSNNYTESKIVSLAKKENRIILSKSRSLVKSPSVTHAFGIRSADPLEQIRDITEKLQLANNLHPLTRCLKCNNLIEAVEKEKIAKKLEKRTNRYYNEFFICPSCNQIYWKGSHYENMLKYIDQKIRNKTT